MSAEYTAAVETVSLRQSVVLLYSSRKHLLHSRCRAVNRLRNCVKINRTFRCRDNKLTNVKSYLRWNVINKLLLYCTPHII